MGINNEFIFKAASLLILDNRDDTTTRRFHDAERRVEAVAKTSWNRRRRAVAVIKNDWAQPNPRFKLPLQQPIEGTA